MYEMNEVECRASSVSNNTENMGAGGETRTGISIYVEYQASNEVLDQFDAKLRPALYESAASGQEDMTGYLPQPKFKFDKPLAWPYEGAGWSAVIHSGLDASEDLALKDVKVDKFSFAIGEEGVVGIKHRLYVHPSSHEQAGRLLALEKHDITLSLSPPPVQEFAAGATANDDPTSDMFEAAGDDDGAEDTPTHSVLYHRAVAAVRATGNPTTSALQQELKIDFNEALALLMEMEQHGVIRAADGEYEVLPEREAAA